MTLNGEEKCTMKDIAAEVGVAKSTVSRVLNNNSLKIPVTEGTRRRILEAAKRLDYTPDINAKRLSRNKTNILALVIPTTLNHGTLGTSDKTVMGMMPGMEMAIADTQYKILLVFKNRSFVDDKEYLRLFKAKCIDGMMIWGAALDDSYISDLAGKPLLLLNSTCSDNRFNSICHDNEAGAFSVTEHMIAQGRRKFIYLGGCDNNSVTIDRERGVLNALSKHGLEILPGNIFKANFSKSLGFEIVDGLLKAGRRDFDAIICANDDSAQGALMAAKANGLKVPEDIILGGGDGMDGTELPFSSFKVDCVEMGRLGVTTLIDIVEGKILKPSKRLIPITLLK